MKRKSEKNLILICLCIIFAICMTGCSKKKDTKEDGEKVALDASNSSEVALRFFKFRIQDTYMSRGNNAYMSYDGNYIGVIESEHIFGSPETFVKYYQYQLKDQYGVDTKSFFGSIEERDNGMTYCTSYAEQAGNYYQLDIVIYDYKAITFLSVAKANGQSYVISDMADIIETVEYATSVSGPSDSNYPYKVQNNEVSVTVTSDYIADIQGSFVDGQSEYQSYNKYPMVYLRGDYDYSTAVLSAFCINRITDGSTLQECADAAMNQYSQQEGMNNILKEEVKMEDVWSNIGEDMKDLDLYVFTLEYSDARVNDGKTKHSIVNSYIYEYNGKFYLVTIMYPDSAKDGVKDKLYDLMYNVEYK